MINKSHLCRIIVLFMVNLNICSITKCRRLIIETVWNWLFVSLDKIDVLGARLEIV